MTLKAKLFATSMILPFAASAGEQDPGWEFAVSPYLWTPGINASVGTALGTVSVDMSTSDVLSKLDLAFMGALEARKGRWGLIADLFYADISQNSGTPLGLAFSRARVETQAKALSAYAAYRIQENDRVALDLLAGFRVSSLNVDLSLSPRLLPGLRLSVGETWVDPVIGARTRVAITDKWFATAFADVGGFNVDSDLTWQVFGSLGYQINPRWSVLGGWRYFSAKKEMDGRDVTTDFSGPLIGVTAQF